MSFAFNIRLPDKSTHAYAQKYCFLNGPDKALNRLLRVTVLESTIELAEERDQHLISFLSFEKQKKIIGKFSNSLPVPPELPLTRKIVNDWIINLGWKVSAIPEGSRNVLIIGSASCREALLIRHWLPGASITCADFEDNRIQNIERALNIQFWQGDFNEFLAERPGQFDVIFSNHVIEHLFNPGETLRLIKRALRPNGCLVSALPLDGQPGVPFNSMLGRNALHPLDFCMVDVAHGWKTNISNLSHELCAAGFSDMRFHGRDKYYSVSGRLFSSMEAFQRRAQIGIRLNRIIFGTLRNALRMLFPDDVPLPVMKVVFGIERRFWFGSNRLKNSYSIECLVIAK